MSENAYLPSEPTIPVDTDRSTNRSLTWLDLGVICCILVFLVGLLLPAVKEARDRPPRCFNTLKQIALALHNYETVNKCFPPAYTVDSSGNRLHSWRTLILPYMEANDIYERVDLTKSWDAPENATARTLVESLPSLRCSNSRKSPKTNILSLVGEEYFFHPDRCRNLAEFVDAKHRTLALIEVPDQFAVHWMEPTDLDGLESLNLAKQRLLHTGVAYVAFVDGSIDSMDSKVSANSLRAISTIAGGEEASKLD